MAEPVYFMGQLRSLASWSKVGRELVRALLRQEVDVRVIEVDDDRPDPAFVLPAELERARYASERPPAGATGLTFASPAAYAQMLTDVRACGIVVYEADRWPPGWVRAITDHLRLALVPARSGCDSLVASGVPAAQVAFLPHGVDQSVYSPRGRPRVDPTGPLRILFVGTPAWRKGLDVLLTAVARAFTPADPISLVLKVVPYADLTSRPYLDHAYRERIAALQQGGYRVSLREDAMSEAEMAALYRDADVLCQPFRGECAPLPVLEAMACGTPVICSDWSGPSEIVDGDVGMPVGIERMVPAAPFLADPAVADPAAEMVEVSADATALALRRAFEDRARLADMGARAAERAACWTWDAVATSLCGILDTAGLR